LLRFGRWRRQVSSFDLRLKSIAGMRAVAKRLVVGIPATAKRDHFATGQPESITGCVLNHYVIAGHAERAVVVAGYHYIILIAHQSSPVNKLFECLIRHCNARAARIESWRRKRSVFIEQNPNDH